MRNEVETKVETKVEIKNQTPNMNDIISKLKTEIFLCASSYKVYVSFLKRINVDLFDTDNVIKWILDKYTNKSTINIYLSALLTIYKLYDRKDLHIIAYKEFVKNKEKPDIVIDPKPIEEAQKIMEDLQVKHNQLKTELTEFYDNTRQMCIVACLYLNHGVIRGDELLNMYINENDNCEYDNYINVEKKQMIIRKHKSMKSMGTRTIYLCQEFMNLIELYANRLLLTNNDNKPYKDATGLTKKIKKTFGNGICDFRYAKSSINLQGVDTELATTQGHQIGTQAKYYRKYK